MLLKESAEGSHKGLEEAIVKHVKQALIDVDAEEFILFIRLLAALPSMNTLTGRQDLVNTIMAQSELDKPFEVSNFSIFNLILEIEGREYKEELLGRATGILFWNSSSAEIWY